MATVSESKQEFFVAVSAGELLDRITILQIKHEHFDGEKRSAINAELQPLLAMEQSLVARLDGKGPEVSIYHSRLRAVNGMLWDLEDEIRKLIRESRVNEPKFLTVSCEIRRLNDFRSQCKHAVNLLTGHEYGEIKSHPECAEDSVPEEE